MLTYPITPDYIQRLPDAAQKAMVALETYLLQDICERLQANGDLSRTAAQHLMILHDRGYDMTRVSARIAQATGIAEREIREAMASALARCGEYYSALYEACGVEIWAPVEMQAELDAINRATVLEFRNITRSLGFSLRGPSGVLQWYDPAQAYQQVLDEVITKVRAGISYSEAIRTGVKQLADSGITVITYDRQEGGAIKTHTNRADVAVRRAVMTGVTKLSQAYADKACKNLGTHLIEVTAHRGARDVDRPNPWSNHKAWQGKVYSLQPGDSVYPHVVDACGLGAVDGLCGANCRHSYHPFVAGIMQRTYTDEQLATIDPAPVTYNGKTYTTYEATQALRRCETALRQVKREMLGYSASGDRQAYTDAAGRFRALDEQYERMVQAFGLRSQRERGNIAEWGPRETRQAEEALAAAAAKKSS